MNAKLKRLARTAAGYAIAGVVLAAMGMVVLGWSPLIMTIGGAILAVVAVGLVAGVAISNFGPFTIPSTSRSKRNANDS